MVRRRRGAGLRLRRRVVVRRRRFGAALRFRRVVVRRRRRGAALRFRRVVVPRRFRVRAAFFAARERAAALRLRVAAAFLAAALRLVLGFFRRRAVVVRRRFTLRRFFRMVVPLLAVRAALGLRAGDFLLVAAFLLRVVLARRFLAALGRGRFVVDRRFALPLATRLRRRDGFT